LKRDGFSVAGRMWTQQMSHQIVNCSRFVGKTQSAAVDRLTGQAALATRQLVPAEWRDWQPGWPVTWLSGVRGIVVQDFVTHDGNVELNSLQHAQPVHSQRRRCGRRCHHIILEIIFFKGKLLSGVLPYWRLDAKCRRPYILPSSKPCGLRSSRTEGHRQLSSAR